MRRSICLLISVLLLCSYGCKRKVTYVDYIQDTLTEAYPNWSADYDSIFIVPRMGCNSCTNRADKIIKSRLKNERNLFILTNIQTKKLVNIEFGKENVSRDNVVMDTSNKYWKQRFVECAYPVLLVTNPDGTLDFKYLLDCFLQ